MCGFTGILAPRGAVVDTDVLTAMTSLQAHRGPDDHGYSYFDLAPDAAAGFNGSQGQGAVGFRRLSIQDLSPAGHQPMETGDGRVAIVFNGEIYNAPALRAELMARGESFRGHSDTEVILRLYERLGDAFLEPLNGMFALAVIDLRRGRLLLARDRLGIKPLYYTTVGDTLLFASELKSFLAHPAFKPELDGRRVDEYVQFRYCAGAGTLLRGVSQLPPAHRLVVDPGGALRPEPYWSLPEGTLERTSVAEAAEELEAVLEASVRHQLLADVEVGCQLSGGIDSSLVNLLAARNASAGMQSFSVTLGNPRFSEGPWIREAARKAGVKSNCYELGADDFIDALDRAAWHLDQPINHPNSLGLQFLAKHASQHVKVLLSGEGADELLGGYPRFFHARLRGSLKPVLPLLGSLPGVGRRVTRRLGQADTPGGRFWIEASDRLPRAAAESLLGRPLNDSALADRLELFERTPGVDYLTKCMNYETATYLVDLLIRQDKMTMSYSLENRVPFLDHTLVEAVRRRMSSTTLVGGVVGSGTGDVYRTKRPLKRISEKYFGNAFTFRPKSGFAIPLREFFQAPRFAQRMQEELMPGIERRGVFASAPVRQAWGRIATASPADLDLLWSMIAFELWARTFLDGRRG